MPLRVGRKGAPALGKKPLPRHLSPARASHLLNSEVTSTWPDGLETLTAPMPSMSTITISPWRPPLLCPRQSQWAKFHLISLHLDSWAFRWKMSVVGSQLAHPHCDPFPESACQHHLLTSSSQPQLSSVKKECPLSCTISCSLLLSCSHSPRIGCVGGTGTLAHAPVSRMLLC